MIFTSGSPIWVEYWPEGSTHNHLLMLSDGSLSHGELLEELEDCAQEFAEQVERCSGDHHRDRHGNPHGQTHPQNEVEKAHKMAIFQLMTRDYTADWQEIEKSIIAWKKWEGPVPAAIVQMDKDGKEELLITNDTGDLFKPELNQDILKDIMPPPKELGAKPNKEGPGWTMPPAKRKGG